MNMQCRKIQASVSIVRTSDGAEDDAARLRGYVRLDRERRDLAMSATHGRDGTEVWWDYAASVGVRCENMKALADTLLERFRASDGGFAALASLPIDVRAIVSDQIVGAAQAAPRNLLEARLHGDDLNSLLEDGVPFPEPSLASQEDSTRIDMAVVGFFRAIGSTLDCLAAGSIGIVRLPLSIRRASFGQLLTLPGERLAEHSCWAQVRACIDGYAGEPPGWLKWALEMRHALMHRPRLMSVMLPREVSSPELALPAHVMRQVMRERIRFDPRFRSRPWLPDMQHLADGASGGLAGSVLAETEIQTARGVFEATQRLAEGLATLLLALIDDADVVAIDPPERNWAIEPDPAIEFQGFAPQKLPREMAGIISPADAERIKLAADLYRGEEKR
jgi:hypothetical protein